MEPVTMRNRITPMEKISTDSPLYDRRSRTSGAWYILVPT